MSVPLVSIAVCTFRRPEGIRNCLESLFAQSCDFSYEIIVVENDEMQPSRAEIESRIPTAAEKGIELRYFCEKQRGISYARNRCVSEARGLWIAFLDDDETARPDWLAHLVSAQRKMNADAVCGTVEFSFADGFPRYLRESQLFRRTKMTQEEPFEMQSFCTNCLLLRKSALTRTPVFDPAFARLGLEDADLAVFFVMNKMKIVRAPLALVEEFQPLSRGRWRFQFERSVRAGVALAKISRKNFGRIAGLKNIFRKSLQIMRLCLSFVPGMFCHPIRNGSDFLLRAGEILGYILYFCGLEWKGY